MTSKERAKDARLRKVYTSSLAEQQQKIADQNGCCAICKRPFPEFSAFQDHYHGCCPRRLKTFCGKCNRGVLCYLCNKYLTGVVERMKMADGTPLQILRLATYLQEWEKVLRAKGCYEAKTEEKKAAKVRCKQKSV
jgi:recombination endonuclease VII